MSNHKKKQLLYLFLLEKAVSDMDACMVINCFPHTNPDVHFREESCLLKM